MRFGREIFIRISGILAVAVVWQLTANISASPAIPPLNRILVTLIYFIRNGTFALHARASLTVILLGIGAATFIGLSLGALMFRYSNFRAAAQPVVESVRGIPALTLFPLLIVLFGLGVFSRAFVIFWTAWPAVVLSTINSLDVDGNVVDAARTFGASDWKIIFCIRVPMAAQGLITGIRIGVGGGWVGLIAAEMLGATRGLGFFLLWSAQAFQFDRVYATIIVIAAIGGTMNWVLLMVQKLSAKIVGG